MRAMVVMAVLWRRGASRIEARSAVGGVERRSRREPATHFVGRVKGSDGRATSPTTTAARAPTDSDVDLGFRAEPGGRQ